MIHYLALHYWSKFQKNLTAFGGVMARKPPRSSISLFNSTIKTMTYIVHYLTLHHWSKFQKSLTAFKGSYGQKNTQKQPEMVFSAATKSFEIWKLGNYKWDINEPSPRNVPSEYLSNTKNEGVNEWVGGRRIQKTTKKRHKINKILTSTSPNNSLQNAMKVGTFLM